MADSREPPQSDGRPDAERRNTQRVEILGSLSASVHIVQRLGITDISAGGLRAVSDFPFQLDALHEFRLTLDDRVVIVKGRIMHSAVIDLDQDGVQYQTGVDFVDLPDRVRQTLEEFAERLARSRQAE